MTATMRMFNLRQELTTGALARGRGFLGSSENTNEDFVQVQPAQATEPSVSVRETDKSQFTMEDYVTKTEFDAQQLEHRKKQIAAMAMKAPRNPRPKDGWRKSVGKYADDSPFNRMLDKGAEIRESERIEKC